MQRSTFQLYTFYVPLPMGENLIRPDYIIIMRLKLVYNAGNYNYYDNDSGDDDDDDATS